MAGRQSMVEARPGLNNRKAWRWRKAVDAVWMAACAIAIAGCVKANSARGVVDNFVDAHYIAINLDDAAQYCTGLALDKVKKEQALTAGQTIDAATRKPTVHYKLQTERVEHDRATYLFLATIDVPEGGQFTRQWMISARLEDGRWKVSNYSEYE
ncbi:MAG TPA: hypothetical protein VGI47_03235 [Candidatus Binataceae bacterium]